MPARRLKDLLFKHAFAKAMALVLAATSWHLVREAISFQVVFREIPVTVVVDEGMASFNQSVQTVAVTFRGSQADIRLLDRQRIRANVDLRGRQPAELFAATIVPEGIEGAHGVHIADINPDRFNVTLDREATKAVPVIARAVGQPLIGDVESVTCVPVSVVITGPEQRLREVESLHTDAIDVDGRVQSFTRRVPVLAPTDAWHADISPAQVEARVAIAEKRAKREFLDVPVRGLLSADAAFDVSVEPARVTVWLHGKSEDLEHIRADGVTAYADCSRLTSGAYELPVKVMLPSGVDSGDVEPQNVRVVLSEQ